MARLSFEKKRAQQPVAHPAEVHVRVSGADSASVGGTAVVAAPGEEIQQAVLNHLQRLAISLGAPIRATIQDDRAGCVVPLEVAADGSSRMAGDPVRLAPRGVPAGVRSQAAVPGASGVVRVPTGQFGPAPVMGSPSAPSTTPEAVDAPPAAQDAAPVAVVVPERSLVPDPAAQVSVTEPAPVPARAPKPVSEPAPLPVAEIAREIVLEPAPATSSTPTPARGFDAVAEEVLGDEPVTETAEGAELLTEPMARINEAVREGRIEAAAELAQRTLVEASGVLGPRHPEVLHLRELAAYIAYLAGEPVRSFRLSLALARLRRQAGDAEGAYGNLQSAATAWRAVREPEEGLRLGRDLIDVWTDLVAEPGPAAEDPRSLESARSRMVRLADRAAKAARV
ncbi:hypothetical protein J2Z21_007014 [Streptomyces griseochromogenes]|uniref:Tetratricopeptide repeat protein n=1 Tax=Streptomyces griseochromogenes TaxID=68214 RepID=A0A1B1AQG8_9ACTN|nr:hypothetical protein [Streptomyces griseochromogenes]ANP48819.1 hypothetical protein AVL59_03840 [Streptomyces griseochromogenes]MBP2054012.1 hypothetical protein [Streptomyces griseochromogenes]